MCHLKILHICWCCHECTSFEKLKLIFFITYWFLRTDIMILFYYIDIRFIKILLRFYFHPTPHCLSIKELKTGYGSTVLEWYRTYCKIFYKFHVSWMNVTAHKNDIILRSCIWYNILSWKHVLSSVIRKKLSIHSQWGANM